jgi:hypothetical protein
MSSLHSAAVYRASIIFLCQAATNVGVITAVHVAPTSLLEQDNRFGQMCNGKRRKNVFLRVLLFKRVSAGDTPRLSPALLQILQCHRYVLRQTCSKQAQARGPVLPIKLCVAMRLVPNFTADGNDASRSRNRRRGPRLGDQKRALQVVVRSIGQVRGGRPCRLGLLIRALSARLVVLEVTKHDLPAECYKQAADVQRCRHVSP